MVSISLALYFKINHPAPLSERGRSYASVQLTYPPSLLHLAKLLGLGILLPLRSIPLTNLLTHPLDPSPPSSPRELVQSTSLGPRRAAHDHNDLPNSDHPGLLDRVEAECLLQPLRSLE